jgi:hypothetical protein
MEEILAKLKSYRESREMRAVLLWNGNVPAQRFEKGTYDASDDKPTA